MAACGGLEHIFEKPLSETPTFLESLSPWKHIKPIDDSSITEIFGELHFKESHVDSSPSTSSNPTDAEEERGRGCASPSYNPPSERNQYKQRRESISSDGLSLCTEGLGFESFEAVEHDVCNREWGDGDGDGERNAARSSISEKHRSEEGSRRRALPPPISSIGRCGTPGVCFRSYKEDGRFILREVRIPTQEFLHACRQDGRLKLQFVHNDDDDDEILDEAKVEDEVEEHRIQEHRVESRD